MSDKNPIKVVLDAFAAPGGHIFREYYEGAVEDGKTVEDSLREATGELESYVGESSDDFSDEERKEFERLLGMDVSADDGSVSFLTEYARNDSCSSSAEVCGRVCAAMANSGFHDAAAELLGSVDGWDT